MPLISFNKFFLEGTEYIELPKNIQNKITKLYLRKYKDKNKIITDIFDLNNCEHHNNLDINNIIDYFIENYDIDTLLPDYINSDIEILQFITSRSELNNISIVLCLEALKLSSVTILLESSKFNTTNSVNTDFKSYNSEMKIKHIIFLLLDNRNSGVQRKYKDRIIQRTKLYFTILNTIKQDIKEHYVDKIWDPI